MKRLILTLTMLTLILSGAITLARLAGGATEPPAFAKWFTNPDGTPCEMPCLFGIRVGVTRMDEAEAILKAHPFIENLFSKNNIQDYSVLKYNFITQNNQNGSISIRMLDGNRSLVDAVTITFHKFQKSGHPITFLDTLIAFGLPKKVSLSHYRDELNLYSYYKNTLVIKSPDFDRACNLNLYSEISTMSLVRLCASQWFVHSLSRAEALKISQSFCTSS